MESICLRTPHILEQISELLDNKSLIKCKEVSRTMDSIIERQKSGKFVTTRVIESYIKNLKEFGKDWKNVFLKLSSEKLKELATLVKEFYKAVPSRLEGNWSPMHIVAERGHLDFCKVIAKLRAIESYEWSPLNLSAQAGHLEVSKFLYKEFEDKQDKRIFGIAQHLAAKNGHLEIYKFLHENLNEINPFMQENITPLHLAAQYGHFEVCKYICDNNAFVAPLRSDTNTPLTLAIHRGHIKIARLLHGRNLWRDMLLFTSLIINIIIHTLFLACLYSIIGITVLDIFIFFLMLTISERTIVKDIMFCLWTSPKLDY